MKIQDQIALMDSVFDFLVPKNRWLTDKYLKEIYRLKDVVSVELDKPEIDFGKCTVIENKIAAYEHKRELLTL